MTLDRLIRRERMASMAINGVLSAAFFLGVFGTEARFLSFDSPDQLARDFLPQGGIIALMATVVPSLLVRKALRKQRGHDVPSNGRIAGQAARCVAAGLALSAALMTACLFSPAEGLGWLVALVIKVLYGALLGAVITQLSLRRLFRHGTA